MDDAGNEGKSVEASMLHPNFISRVRLLAPQNCSYEQWLHRHMVAPLGHSAIRSSWNTSLRSYQLMHSEIDSIIRSSVRRVVVVFCWMIVVVLLEDFQW